jgi:hypothetical protein
MVEIDPGVRRVLADRLSTLLQDCRDTPIGPEAAERYGPLWAPLLTALTHP